MLTQRRSPAEPPTGSASHPVKTPRSLFKVTKPPPGASSYPQPWGTRGNPPTLALGPALGDTLGGICPLPLCVRPDPAGFLPPGHTGT